MKKLIFYLLALLMLFIGGFLSGELLLRLIDTVNPKSTWLQMDERGFMKNIPDRTNLHSLGDIRVHYELSSLGTRGDEPDSTDFNIFVFGDSFTFGLYLPEEHTFINRLNEKSDSNTTFINAGVGGTGLADWVAQFEVNLKEKNYAETVDGILLVTNFDDFARALTKNLYKISGDSQLVASKRWEERDIKKWLDNQEWYLTLLENSRIVSALQSLLWPWYYVDLTETEQSGYSMPGVWYEGDEEQLRDYTMKLAELLVNRLHDVALEHQIPLFITTTGYLTEEKLTSLNQAGLDGFKRAIEIRNLPFVDITDSLSKKVNGDYESITIPTNTHPDSLGAALIGEIMAEKMILLITKELEQSVESQNN